MSSGQVVGELRTLVARRVGLRRKVVLLARDEAVEQALRHNGCEVLVDPASPEEVRAFGPEAVVGFDGFFSHGAEGLRAVAQAAPTATVVFSFANASASSALIGALLGDAPAGGVTEPDVQRWLAEAGYVMTSRDVVVTSHRPSALCAETHASLRQLFEQLNPAAAADRLLVVAERGIAVSPPEVEEGLTSVVLSSGDDLGALEGTLRSVMGQLQRPLEVVLVSSLLEAALDPTVQLAKGRAGVSIVVLAEASADELTRTNVGLAHARGQFVCCLEAGELLDRSHVATLVKRLKYGTEAWALSSPPLDMGPRFELRDWLQAGGVQRGRFVVDRTRLGAFPLRFAEGVALSEASFFCRLSALFSPAWVHAPCTLDSPRVVASSPEALLEAFQVRPLRSIRSLEIDLQTPEQVSLGALVEDRLTTKHETAGRVFGQLREVVARVRVAATDAVKAAREER
jgi:hypothetical protein